MIQFVAQRILIACLRLLIASLIMLVGIELAFRLAGGAIDHAWTIAPELFSGAFLNDLFFARLIGSSLVFGLGFLLVLFVGYGWGLVAARLRWLQARLWLSAPLALLSCFPIFWVLVMVAAYAYWIWDRPGFANEIAIEEGPDWLGWWHAAVQGLCVGAGPAVWQLGAVSAIIGKSAAQPFVGGLFRAGFRESFVFYRHFVRGSISQLCGLLDRTVPCLIGGLIVAETAFRYDGLGSWLVASALGGDYLGMFVAGWCLTLPVVAIRCFRECLERFWDSAGDRSDA
ncbi:MAG: ABC transporter permease subunit [Verrucomicrobiota bacterium]